MKGDFHVRFRENVRVKFPRVTRLWLITSDKNRHRYESKKRVYESMIN